MSAFAHSKNIFPRRGLNTGTKIQKIFELCKSSKQIFQKIIQENEILSKNAQFELIDMQNEHRSARQTPHIMSPLRYAVGACSRSANCANG